MPEKKPLVVTFTKMNGAGNDFIVFDNRFLHFSTDELAAFARRFCPRRTGVGADGLLVLDPPEEEGKHFRMRYRNADGSPAGLCGNGARCLARFAREAGLGPETDGDATLVFASDAGTHRATVPADANAPVRFYASPPHSFEAEVSLHTGGLSDRLAGPVAFVNTGTQHVVSFVDRVEEVPVAEVGAQIRRDEAFAPEGANANFVEVARTGGERAAARLLVRTFEKGVEDETLACGTGAMAAAVVAYRTGQVHVPTVEVEMPGGLLQVGFRIEDEEIDELYLEGPAEKVFQGTVEVHLGG